MVDEYNTDFVPTNFPGRPGTGRRGDWSGRYGHSARQVQGFGLLALLVLVYRSRDTRDKVGVLCRAVFDLLVQTGLQSPSGVSEGRESEMMEARLIAERFTETQSLEDLCTEDIEAECSGSGCTDRKRTTNSR